MGGRLREDTLQRFVDFGLGVLSVIDDLERGRRPRRIIDQLVGSGTSAGANAFEASEAMSTKDFLKCLGVTAKELNETRFWLLLLGKAAWAPSTKTDHLLNEVGEFLKILKAIIVRTKASRRRTRDDAQ